MLRGRPTKLTPELAEKFCTYCRKGMSLQGSAALCGITKQAFFEWAKRGADGEQPYADFIDSVEHARAQAEYSHVRTINKARRCKAGEIDWKASQFWLQTARRDHGWGNTVRQEVTGADGGPVKVEEAGASIRSKLDRLAAAFGTGTDSEGSGSESGS